MAPVNTDKKQNRTTELKANIDNTGSVKEIIDALEHRNTRAHTFYSRNIRQRKTTKTYLQNYHFVLPGHPLNAFSDDWDGQLNIDYFESFPYKCFPPKMITILQNVKESDPVTKHMKAKMQWERNLNNLKLSATFTNLSAKYEMLNEEVVQCPKHLIDMAAHLHRQPDPYFNSTYNWYYAGHGNLQQICIDCVDYLLYSNFNCVYLSPFVKGDVAIKSSITTFECDKDNNILETICLNNIVTLRTKNIIYILKLTTVNNEVKFEKLKCIKSELPYTSICYDNHHKNILYVSTLDYKLSIINLDRMKMRSVKLNAKMTSLIDNWNTVIGSGGELYTHVTKSSICIYDKRNNNQVNVWNGLKGICDDITCNEISVARHFEGTSQLYFATDHHMFLMDLRYGSNTKPQVLQRWTHGMEVAPTYLSYCSFEFSKYLICLSSQWCEDMCVIPNYNDRIIKEPQSGGMTLPYRPPSILNVLSEARQKMLCCDLYNPIDSRLCSAITGSLILEQGEKYRVFMQNSIGDISLHTIFPEHLGIFLDDDSTQCLNDWCQDFKIEKKAFEMSSVVNIATMLKTLKRVPSSYKVDDSWVKRSNRFNEKEIDNAFENEEIDPGLRDIWIKGPVEPIEQSSLTLDWYYSDGE